MTTIPITHSSLTSFLRSVPRSMTVNVEPVIDWCYDGDDRVGHCYVEVTSVACDFPGIAEVDQLLITVGTFPASTVSLRTTAQQVTNEIADTVLRLAACYWQRVKTGRVHIEPPLDERQTTPWISEEWQEMADASTDAMVKDAIGVAV